MNTIDTAMTSTKPIRSPRSPTKHNRESIMEESSPGIRTSEDDNRSASDDVELNDLSDDDDNLEIDEETGLTGRDKSRRKRRRRRNTLLDQRIAGDVKISEEERKEADQTVFKSSLINGLLICLWYLFSLSISIVSFNFNVPSFHC